MEKLRVLDLFSGIGGFSLGLERAGMQTVAFCEINEFCRRVLGKHWPGVPIFEDVRKLKGSDVGEVDVVCGGYPCQPFSLAGQRRGAEDDRHLWPEMCRLVDELRPAWVIGENVAGHISMGLDVVLSDLEALGYACRPFVIPAVALDARHRRDRLWIVAHASGKQRRLQQVSRCQCEDTAEPQHDGPPESMADAKRPERRPIGCACDGLAGANGISQWTEGAVRLGGGRQDVADAERRRPACGSLAVAHQTTVVPAAFGSRDGGEMGAWWRTEPIVGRVAHGVPSRVDRLRGLGNAVVPQIPEAIGRAILAAEVV